MSSVFGELFKDAKAYKVRKGALLVLPEEPPRGVHYIHTGYVKAYDIQANGECQLLAIHGPGDFFPIHWSLDDEEQLLFYETMCPTTFSIMQKLDFKTAVYGSHDSLSATLAYLLKVFRISQKRIQNLEYLTTQQRLAFRLVFLAEHFGCRVGEGVMIHVPIVYQDLADAINSTRDTVNRTMKQFAATGILGRKQYTVTIYKLGALQAMLDIGAS